MDALPFVPVELAAIDPARNLRRRWRVAAMRDLFGRVMVETSWGRIGTRGRTLVRSFTDDGVIAEVSCRTYAKRFPGTA